MAVASVAHYDWPEDWPDLLPFLLKLINDQTNVNAGKSFLTHSKFKMKIKLKFKLFSVLFYDLYIA